MTIKSKSGKKLKTFEEILQNYFETSLIIDSVNVLSILLSIFLDFEVFLFFRLLVIAKIPESLEKLEKLEAFFIKNYYN